jgi:alanine dehydrogenase
MRTRRSVSILKERLPNETRVVLLPEQVALFTAAGIEVLIESGAGVGAGCPDAAYQAVSARIVSVDEAWAGSSLILKLFAPSPAEYERLNQGTSIGGFLHAEGRKPLVEALKKQRCTAYAYEYFRTPDGIFPMAVPLSEISGQMAVIYGAYYLQAQFGGRGVLLPATPGAVPARVLVIGYGNAGTGAARLAASMGARVVVLGTHREKLRHFQALMPPGTECYLNTPEVLEREVLKADLVIGTILISTFDTPPMIEEALVRRMKPGSMIVDVTCGHGRGYLPSFDRFTTHRDPVYIKHGVLHCKIDILPAGVPLSAGQANSAVIAPYLLRMAESLFDPSRPDPTSAAGKIIENGRVVHPEIARNMVMIDALEEQAREPAVRSA